METKEQKIDRLKKEMILVQDKLRFFWESQNSISIQILDNVMRDKSRIEQQLKELEDDTKKSR